MKNLSNSQNSNEATRVTESPVLVIEEKMDELLVLMENSDLDSSSFTRLQEKFNSAVEKKKSFSDKLKEFEGLDDLSSRLEMADNLENLLSKYQVDSKVSQKYLLSEKLLKVVLLLTSCLLIGLGFALIVMPATPDFEMFTIFYFTRDDGFTLMDLIALLIVFAGVYLLIRSLVKSSRTD